MHSLFAKQGEVLLGRGVDELRRHSAGEGLELGTGPNGDFGGGGGDVEGLWYWVILMNLLHEELSGAQVEAPVFFFSTGDGGWRLVGIFKLVLCVNIFHELSGTKAIV